VDRKTALVLKGFVELNTAQRDEFVDEINKYISDTSQRRKIEESLQKSISNTINFGPAPSSCPCCGK
jgi:hypothetical protein